MTATIKAAISPFAQAQSEFDSNPMDFLNEDLASVPVSGIPDEFRKLSRYLAVIVLVPKSAVHVKTTQKKPDTHKSSTGLIENKELYLPSAAMKNGVRNSTATINFELGGELG